LTGINDENAGRYRAVPVEIAGSAYKPPSPESVAPSMRDFGNWLAANSCPGENFATTEGLLRAAAVHTWFVQIHPFIDGNGRVARLLMNLLLMRHGYPIAIITREDRSRYYDSLEESQTSNLGPLLSLLCECAEESLEEYEQAAKAEREQKEWAREIADRFTKPQRVRVQNEYELWKAAMELLRSYFQQTALAIDKESRLGRIYFKEFGILEFEKYITMREGESAKQTWFFRVDFRIEQAAARYLFFFQRPSFMMRNYCSDVSLCVAREEKPFFFERLEDITAPNTPNLVEIGYMPSEEKFATRDRNGLVHTDKIDSIGRKFIEEVVKMHFSRR
jgi:fido (protein-threonine AMPylation protein)